MQQAKAIRSDEDISDLISTHEGTRESSVFVHQVARAKGWVPKFSPHSFTSIAIE